MDKHVLIAVALAWTALIISPPTQAGDTPEPITLEERVTALETKTKESPLLVVNGKDGLQIKSADGSFALKIGGALQTDYRDYRADQGSFTDQFLIRRARLIIDGTLGKTVIFRLMPEFANGGTTPGATSTLLPDAFLEWQPRAFAKVRVGKFKSPVGLEMLQSDTHGPFVEKTLTSQLVPNRDTGAGLHGDLGGGIVTYQVAFFNGVADAASSENDNSDGKDYVGRLFAIPFKQATSEWINGLGFGVGGSIGDVDGNTSTPGLTSGYRTDGQQTFFTYQTGTFANGQRKRIAPQAYWYTSRVALLSEYVASSQEIQRSNDTATIINRAWQVAGSFVLTGERPSFNGVKVRQAFDPKKKTWGAVEWVGRYAILKIEDEAFATFADPLASAKKAKAWSTGFNWYFNNNVRLASNYAVTSFLGGAAAGQNRLTEKVFLNRIQVVF